MIAWGGKVQTGHGSHLFANWRSFRVRVERKIATAKPARKDVRLCVGAMIRWDTYAGYRSHLTRLDLNRLDLTEVDPCIYAFPFWDLRVQSPVCSCSLPVMRNLDGVRLVQYEDYRLDLEETKGDSSNKICTVYYGRYPESKLLMVIHCDIYKNLIETYAQQESFPLDISIRTRVAVI